MIHSSLYWKNHFEVNLTRKRINWYLQPQITSVEKDAVLYSLKAWQLGETSDGSHLLAAANRYAQSINDPVYPEAVSLFIKEEQKHGNNLGKYIDLIGEPRAKKDLGDTLFRKIRYFNTNMEIWTITVIIVESAAQLFYNALHDATSCPLLKSICNDILIDEAHHIKFQSERLKVIFSEKSFLQRVIAIGFYEVLFLGTIHAIWFGHQKAFKAGGYSRKRFMQLMHSKFFKVMHTIHVEEKESAFTGAAI
jgi:hypothetical protein